jgi:membrane protein DedA with SNARE-associated domain
MHTTKYWFPAKRFGWGWGLPSAWQGWVVLLGFVVELAVSALALLPESPAQFAVAALIWSGVLTTICYARGEPPSWRWGDGR